MQRIAVVTGASSGIGEATARALAAQGWRCVLVARREDLLRTLADEIGGEVELCDVGERAAVEALAARVLERHPAIDVLVNNAGMPARGTFLKADLDLVERAMRVNYLGGVWCTRALHAGPRGGGARRRAARTSSTWSRSAGTVSFAPAGGYAASKHAQLAFSRSLAAALRGTASPSTRSCPASSRPRASRRRACSRAGSMLRFVIEAEDVADAVVKAIEKNKAETVDPVVPVPARRDRAGGRARHRRPVRRDVGLPAGQGLEGCTGVRLQPDGDTDLPQSAALSRHVPADLDLVYGARRHPADAPPLVAFEPDEVEVVLEVAALAA